MKAIEIDDKTEVIYYCLSMAYQKTGEISKANEYLEKSREMKEKTEELEGLLK